MLLRRAVCEVRWRLVTRTLGLPLSAWITPALILAAIALKWSIATWTIKRREEIAEKKQRAVLAVTTSVDGVLEFYPIGGVPPDGLPEGIASELSRDGRIYLAFFLLRLATSCAHSRN